MRPRLPIPVPNGIQQDKRKAFGCKRPAERSRWIWRIGAGEEIRTPDFDLGKVALYR